MKKLCLLSFFIPFIYSGCAVCDQYRNDHIDRFTAGSFNLRVTRDKAPNDWKNRAPRMIALLKELDYTIFGAQEVVDDHIRTIKAQGYAMIGTGRNADGSGEHSAIFYRADRLECLKHQTFWLSATPDVPGSKTWNHYHPRICTFGIFKIKSTGRIFVFANTHFDHISQEAREKSAELLVKKLQPLTGKYPLILTGDFNSRPESVQIGILSRSFRDARFHAEKVLPGPAMTFHRFISDPARRKHRAPIDYIFVNDKVSVKCFAVVDDFKNGLAASDHFPLTAVIVL